MAQQPFRHFLGPCVTWLQGLEIALFSLKPIEPVKWLAFGQSPIGFVAQTPGSVWRKVGWVRSLSQGEDSLPRTCDPTNTLLCKGSAYICNPPLPKKKHANFFEFPNYMSSLLNLGLWLSDDSCFYDFYVTLGVALKNIWLPAQHRHHEMFLLRRISGVGDGAPSRPGPGRCSTDQQSRHWQPHTGPHTQGEDLSGGDEQIGGFFKSWHGIPKLSGNLQIWKPDRNDDWTWMTWGLNTLVS